jgi:hypothetical protein
MGRVASRPATPAGRASSSRRRNLGGAGSSRAAGRNDAIAERWRRRPGRRAICPARSRPAGRSSCSVARSPPAAQIDWSHVLGRLGRAKACPPGRRLVSSRPAVAAAVAPAAAAPKKTPGWRRQRRKRRLAGGGKDAFQCSHETAAAALGSHENIARTPPPPHSKFKN